jgi:hypothetical protein
MRETTHPTGAADTDDPRSSLTLIVGVIGAVIVFLICVLLQALFVATSRAEQQRKIWDTQPAELRSINAEQLERLNDYRWVDQQAGVAAIPIERAMELVVEDYEGRGK